MNIRKSSFAIIGVCAVLAGTVYTPSSGYAKAENQARLAPHDGKVDVQVGSEQKMLDASQLVNDRSSTTMLGPVQYIDSLFTDHCHRVHHRRRCFGLMSAATAYEYDMSPKSGALSNERIIMAPGSRYSAMHCGIHPIGVIQRDPRHPHHLWTLFHAERAWPQDPNTCVHGNHHTRWTIRRMHSNDNGRTWNDDGKVVSQDTNLLIDPTTGQWNFLCDDTGSPHMVRQGDYMYLFYRACTEQHAWRRMTIARAPVRRLGMPGTWHKWYDGAWSQPGIGGKASIISSLPQSARGIAWNRYLHSYIAVWVNITGGYLYRSAGRDLMHWSPVATGTTVPGQLWATGLTVSVWHHHCRPSVGEPAAYGYGSPIGLHYNPGQTGQSFWAYYMHKPAGKCMTDRLLVRRQITLN